MHQTGDGEESWRTKCEHVSWKEGATVYLKAKKYNAVCPLFLSPTHWLFMPLPAQTAAGIGRTSGVNLFWALLLNITNPVFPLNQPGTYMWHSFPEESQVMYYRALAYDRVLAYDRALDYDPCL